MTQNIDPREQKRVVTETEETVTPAAPVKETTEETTTERTTETTER